MNSESRMAEAWNNAKRLRTWLPNNYVAVDGYGSFVVYPTGTYPDAEESDLRGHTVFKIDGRFVRPDECGQLAGTAMTTLVVSSFDRNEPQMYSQPDTEVVAPSILAGLPKTDAPYTDAQIYELAEYVVPNLHWCEPSRTPEQKKWDRRESAAQWLRSRSAEAMCNEVGVWLIDDIADRLEARKK